MENQTNEWPLFSAEEAGRRTGQCLSFIPAPASGNSLVTSTTAHFLGGEHHQGGLGWGGDGEGGQRTMRERVGRERMAVSLQGQMGREESRGDPQRGCLLWVCDVTLS